VRLALDSEQLDSSDGNAATGSERAETGHKEGGSAGARRWRAAILESGFYRSDEAMVETEGRERKWGEHVERAKLRS
jgi:hypothetical protein